MSIILKSYQVASYMRLSREDGDKVLSDSIANQKSMIADYINEHDGLVLTEEFVDDGYSGTTFDRPAFARMMAAIKAKEINCVIVKDLSRLGRNYIETGRYLENIPSISTALSSGLTCSKKCPSAPMATVTSGTVNLAVSTIA